MITKEITCVICPTSCRITVTGEGDKISEILNATCKRGEAYAKDEFIAPKRTLTSTVKAIGYNSPVIAVRSSVPIPKEKVFDVMVEVRKVVAEPPFYIGKVFIPDVLNTGADIILTNC